MKCKAETLTQSIELALKETEFKYSKKTLRNDHFLHIQLYGYSVFTYCTS